MVKKHLTPEQKIAIGYLSQPKQAGLTLQEIADECGVHRNTLRNWREQLHFEDALKREIVRTSQSRLPELVASMSDVAIKEGSAAMAKLVLQMNGMLVDKQEIKTSQASEDEIDYDKLEQEIEDFEKHLN